MLENLSKRITSYFILKNIIDSSQQEMCEYSLQTRILSCATVSVLFLIGIWQASVMETTLFLWTLLSLRKRAGGYHANSELKCFCLSVLLTIVSIYYILPLMQQIGIVLSLGIYLLSVMLLLWLAPINHPNMNMSLKELYAHKEKMHKQILIQSFFIVLIGIFNFSMQIVFVIILGTAITAVSVVISKIIKQEVKI